MFCKPDVIDIVANDDRETAPGAWGGSLPKSSGATFAVPVSMKQSGFFSRVRGVLVGSLLLSFACTSADSSEAEFDAGIIVDSYDAFTPPLPPQGLEHWLTGSALDAQVQPGGPALLLAGGGSDQDGAFAWAQTIAPGGDLVVLRTSGSDGYNDYLYADIGGFDSIETLMLDSREISDDAYVGWTIRNAEIIFMAGGDQWTYIDNWRDTGVQSALADAWQRGAVIGGTSAGCAVLGEFAFSAENDTVYSSEALEDPYNEFMALERDFLSYPLLDGIITDTHFGARDRMGRLATFLARILKDGWHAAPIGIGIDEATALLVDSSGSAEVIGNGSVYLLAPTNQPGQCTAGQPLTFENIPFRELRAGDSIDITNPTSGATFQSLSITDGVMFPADPY